MKRNLILALLLLTFSMVSVGCLKKMADRQDQKAGKESLEKYGPMEDYGAKVDNEIFDVPYAEGLEDDHWLVADVFYIDHANFQPMVINIHGGAWEIGDKSDVNSMFRSKYVAAHGYVVVNINYRLLPSHPVQTQIEDVMGAVIWAKENAMKFGGDARRVGVMGGSAGGHLASMVAWASDDPFFTPTGHADSRYDSDVKAAVLFYGVYDFEDRLTRFPRDKKTGLGGIAHRYFTGMKKGPERDELFRHVSPKYHIDSAIPPSYFVCGDEDNFHLYSESVLYSEKVAEAGVPTGLYTAEGAVHGFDRDYGADYSVEALEKTVEWFDTYLR